MRKDWIETTWGQVSELKYGKSLTNYRNNFGSVEVFGSSGMLGLTTEALGIGPRPIVGRKGSLGIHLARGAFWVIDTAYWLEPSQDLDPTWAYYALSDVDMVGMDSGSAIPSLTRDHFHALKLTLPPLQQQLLVAQVLGALDDLIFANNMQMSRIDQLALNRFLNRWDGQTKSRIDGIGNVVMGQSPAGDTLNEASDGTVFYQGVRDFGDRYPTPRVFCTAPTRFASHGDILIAVRAPVGDTNVATEKTAIGRGVASLTARFPAIALRALRAAESTWAPYQNTGTVFSSITGPDLRGVEVPYFEDVAVEESLKCLDELHYGLYMENTQLLRARNEILPLLLSGVLRVRELSA